MRSVLSRVTVIAALLLSSLGLGTPIEARGHRWGDIVGPVTASSLGICMPTTMEEVAQLTVEDNDRIRAAAEAQFPQVEALIAEGVLMPESKIAFPQPSSARATTSGSGGRMASLRASHLFSDARCSIDWQGYPFSGTYVWGWGQTVANSYARVHAIGDVYQNGTWKGRWGQELNGTIAQGSSEHFWVAWWDHPTFVNNSDHWIMITNTNTYDWGPWYCSVTHTV